MSYYRIVFQRDPETDKPKRIVAFKIGMGTCDEAESWPWNEAGCRAAGAWGCKHKAVVGDLHSRIHSPHDLMVHVPGTPTGPRP